jgi:hypothetical protein
MDHEGREADPIHATTAAEPRRVRQWIQSLAKAGHIRHDHRSDADEVWRARWTKKKKR